MKQLVICVMILVDLGILAVPYGLGAVFELKSVADGDPQFCSVARLAARSAGKFDARSIQEKGVPKDLGDSPMFFVCDLRRDMSLLLAANLVGEPVLYIDANGNYDVNDERKSPAAGDQMKPEWVPEGSVVFGPVAIPAPGGKGSVRVFVAADSGGMAIVYPAGLVQGQISLGGRELAVAVMDADYDGCYDGVFSSPREANDLLLLDLNSDGRFDEETEVGPLTRLLKLDSGYFSLAVAPVGSSMTVESVSPRLGALEVPGGGAEVRVVSENGAYRLDASEGNWELPEGKYYVVEYALTESDDSGSWKIAGIAAPQAIGVSVTAGAAAALEIGPPLTLGFNTGQLGAGIMGVIIDGPVGRGGEYYSAAVAKDGEYVDAPQARIIDESGNVLAEGAFKYG